ncbi:MAG: DUF493 domain-containing protein [Bdellovibrionia bacterium]
MMTRYTQLKELLEREKFPLSFPFKVIGKNSPTFVNGIQQFTQDHPEFILKSKAESAHQKHVSFTLELQAQSADPIIDAYEQLSKIPGALMVL